MRKVKNLLLITMVLINLQIAGQTLSNSKSGIVVPIPLSVGIDDMGWKQAWSSDVMTDRNKPHHIDCQEGRWMTLSDYESVVNIAKKVDSRLLGLFIMSEFDRSNICAEFPSTTEYGKNWDNSSLVSDDDFKIMDYVKDNAAFLEFGLHGVRHEYWENGKIRTGEFANNNYNKKPYPLEKMQNHLQCYKYLLDQYNITFPKSFVPPKHCYYHKPEDSMDTGGLMASWGIKYVSWGHKYWGANYDERALNPMSNMLYNHGVLVLERDQSVPWSKSVGVAPDTISTDFYYECTHWHNYVAAAPKDNPIVGEKWVQWFNMIKDSPDRYLPKNTSQLNSQALYLKYANILIDGNKLTIDNTQMPDWAYEEDFVGNLVIKIPLDNEQHISSVLFSSPMSVASCFKDRGFGYVVLPKLEQQKYEVIIHTGTTQLYNCVVNNGTYNINKMEIKDKKVLLDVEMYGTQNIHIRLKSGKPTKIKSLNKGLSIESWKWNADKKVCEVMIKAGDIQGVTGKVEIKLSI